LKQVIGVFKCSDTDGRECQSRIEALEFLEWVWGQVGILPSYPPAMFLSEWTLQMVHRQDGKNVTASNGVIGFLKNCQEDLIG
jgi:hypothetical protein